MKRLLLVLFLFVCSVGLAQTPVKPYTFSKNDPVSSSKVNLNFDTVYRWCQELATASLTLTNKSISGEQINSGTVADARIASTICRDSELSAHTGLTAAHGATGAVVGTTNSQTIYSKTIYSSSDTGSPYWHKSNDGSGSGLDADKLDGNDSSFFATAAALAGYLPISGGSLTGDLEVGYLSRASNSVVRVMSADSYTQGFEAYGNSQGTGYLYVGQSSAYGGGIFYNGDLSPAFASGEGSDRISFYRMSSGNKYVVFDYSYGDSTVDFKSTPTVGGSAVFHGGSHGFLQANGWGSLRLQNSNGYIDFGPANTSYAHIYTDRPFFYLNKEIYVNGNFVWNAGNDGSGSGLSADNLDGYDYSSFVLKSSPAFSGSLDVNNYNINEVGHIVINDPGGNEGIEWAGGNGWKIFEAPNDFSNAAGNFQIVTGSTRRFTLDLLGDGYLTDNKIWHEGNDGAGSGLDADTLDGLTSSYFVRKDGLSNYYNFSANRPIGWYTIAVNVGNRAVARFALTDIAGGKHQTVIFYACHYYGNGNQISVLHSGHYSGWPIGNIRIKEGGTYDGAMLQVYVRDATNNLYIRNLGDEVQISGWVLKNCVPDGTDPGGLGNFSACTNVAAQVGNSQVTGNNFATTGEIYCGGATSQYMVWHKGNDTVLSQQPCSFYVPGIYTANEVICRFIAPRSITLPAACSGSYAKLQTANSSAITFAIYKNTTSVGTINFAASATSATFTLASAQTLAAGDVLEVRAPSVAGTAAGLTLTFMLTHNDI